ncbi:hypothetical protein A0H81_06305 [Grifola frondosa]|uniref:Uncharacterized protein n=1 Tax=Grifola frondosa TaxID=5627 RepID=A0A1C7MBT5_GRIFR|nr:hypothetical protein A0H81_06305 [Grifola frondosa]
MKDRLVVLAKTMPLRIYAIACADRLEDVARAAALEVRTSRQFKKYVDELEEIRADAYYRLLAYCEKPGPGPVDQVFCDPPAI